MAEFATPYRQMRM